MLSWLCNINKENLLNGSILYLELKISNLHFKTCHRKRVYSFYLLVEINVNIYM